MAENHLLCHNKITNNFSRDNFLLPRTCPPFQYSQGFNDLLYDIEIMAAASPSEFSNPLRKFKLVFLGEQSGTLNKSYLFITFIMTFQRLLFCCILRNYLLLIGYSLYGCFILATKRVNLH